MSHMYFVVIKLWRIKQTISFITLFKDNFFYNSESRNIHNFIILELIKHLTNIFKRKLAYNAYTKTLSQ